MPVVSRFLGISIAILYRDHEPPHFHAFYGEHEVAVEIVSGAVRGRFPPRARAHVIEWLLLHREALMANWERARAREPLVPVPPLE